MFYDEHYVPTYIKQFINMQPKQTVTAERWNELFNLLITQGDDNAHAISEMITQGETEAARKEAERLRALAEEQRVLNEDARISAETIRDTAEKARLAEEATRESNESKRVVAEDARGAAELLRLSSEKERNNSETIRVSAESTRVLNENTRIDAETVRISAEDTRVKNENERITAENQRVLHEAERVRAETERVLAELQRVDVDNGIVAQATQQANLAQGYAVAALNSSQSSKTFADASKNSASAAQDSATAAQNASDSAAESATNADTRASDANSSAVLATTSSTFSQSWAIGGTGTRPGEDTNNAKFWSEQAAAAAGGGVSSFNGRNGVVMPAAGDYTAVMVGARANDWMPTAEDVGAATPTQLAEAKHTTMVVTALQEGGSGYKADKSSTEIINHANAGGIVVLRYTEPTGRTVEIRMSGQTPSREAWFFQTFKIPGENKVKRVDATVNYAKTVTVKTEEIDLADYIAQPKTAGTAGQFALSDGANGIVFKTAIGQDATGIYVDL